MTNVYEGTVTINFEVDKVEWEKEEDFRTDDLQLFTDDIFKEYNASSIVLVLLKENN
jgi:hypothetical protein